MKQKNVDLVKNRQINGVGRNIRYKLTVMLTDQKVQNSSEIEKRSLSIVCFKNNKAENTDVFFKYIAIKGHRMVL